MAIRLKASLPHGRKCQAGGDEDCSSLEGKGKREQVSLKKRNKCGRTLWDWDLRGGSALEDRASSRITAQPCCTCSLAAEWRVVYVLGDIEAHVVFWKCLGEAQGVPCSRSRDLQPLPLYAGLTLGSVWQVLVFSAGCYTPLGGTTVP